MNASLTLSFSIYRKNPKYWGFAVFLWVGSMIMLWREAQYPSTALVYLIASLKLGLLGFVFYLLNTYEFISSIQRSGGKETIMSHKNAMIHIYFAHISTMLISLIIWVAIIVLAQYIWQGSAYADAPLMRKQMILSIILYCFFPGVIGILLGATLSDCSRPVIFIITSILTLCISPIIMDFFSRVVFPGGIQLAAFLDWFAISVPNTKWYPDGLYGVGLEVCRWALAGMWCCFPFGIMLLKLRRFSSKGFLATGWAISAIALFFFAVFVFRDNEYILQKDDRPTGSLNIDEQYYSMYDRWGDNPATFSVSNYDLQLCFPGHLEVIADVSIEGEQNTNYVFTLHHGLYVYSVTDGYSNLAFSRDGDYLEIQGPLESEHLVITYAGNAGKYYANHQAVMLPGYLAYYPIPGRWNLWDDTADSIRTSYPSQLTHFHVSISESSYPIYCNLPETSQGIYEGIAETVTIMGGMVTSKSQGELAFCYSPQQEYSLDFSAEQVETCWKKISEELGISEQISMSGKIVFLMPPTIIAKYCTNETLVVYSDHILLANGGDPNAEQFCQELILQTIPTKSKNTPLYFAFLNNLFGFETSAPEQKPDRSELSLLYEYDTANEIADEKLWSEYIEQEEIAFAELFAWQVETIGKPKVMRAVYNYLIEEDHEKKQVEFLYNLEVEAP